MTIDHTYFTSINSCEKAYMLGLIVFNIKENSSDKIIVEIDLKIDKIKGTDVELSYNMYNKLSNIDKKNYNYYKNVDKLIDIFKKIGKVQCDNYNILQLTIASLYIIKDIFVKHLDLYLVNTKYYDLSLFMNTICNSDKNLLNNFMKAYIEKNGVILKNNIYIKVYNYNTLKQITEIYKTPHKVLKEEVHNNPEKNIDLNKDYIDNELYILEYKNSNMIDFLGQIYVNDKEVEDFYINNYIYNFLNYGDNNIESPPILKIYKADEKAIVPTKNNYSDAGLDLTIISEYKKLNSDTTLYDTGIKLEIPNGYYVEIVPRSSISRSGYMLANSIGIIDQGYTGNLYVALRKINKGCEDLVLPYKCCQIIMKKQIYPKIIIEDLTKERKENILSTSRGAGGFGSTDVNQVK
jgi:deoxyuridine 5'-triphosphate nucleotidohydrolase